MPRPLLRRLDQLAIGALAAAAIASMSVWLATQYWSHQGLVNIEEATPLHYQFVVNVNRAEWPELAQLPGIGEVLAKRIIAARAEGRFRSARDLLRVEGIGPRRLAQMQRYLLPLPEDEMVAGNGPVTDVGGT